jgi:hypothetical protein
MTVHRTDPVRVYSLDVMIGGPLSSDIRALSTVGRAIATGHRYDPPPTFAEHPCHSASSRLATLLSRTLRWSLHRPPRKPPLQFTPEFLEGFHCEPQLLC